MSSTATPLRPSVAMPAWKNVASHVAAALVAILFLAAGIYKAVDPFHWSRLLEELLFPPQYSQPFTLLLSVGEIFGGVMILIPRYRRLGAWLTGIMLVGFMAYIGIHYTQLIGKDCSCFPWVKRTVGPGFFMGDAAFLAGSIIAGWWGKPLAHPSFGFRLGAAVAALVASAALAGGGYAYAASQQTGAKAPESVMVNGKPYSLEHGRYFVFFFDPECGHCIDAGRHLGTYHWESDVTIIGVPTRVPQFGADFMHDSKLAPLVSTDLQKLKAAFPLPGDPPYGVAIDNGRQFGAVQHYDDEDNGKEPAASLKQLGLID